jgi:hypothetical protein
MGASNMVFGDLFGITALLVSERFSSLNTKPNLWSAIFYSPFTPLSAVCGLLSVLKTKRV